MLFPSSRFLASASVIVLAGAVFATSEGLARDYGRRNRDVVQEVAPLSRGDASDIIFEMPPLQPVKKSAVAAAPPPAKVAEPAKAAEPEKVAAPANARPANTPAAAALPEATAPAPVVESAKPAAVSATPAPEAQQPAAPPAQSQTEAPPEQAVATPAEGILPGAPTLEQPVAEAPPAPPAEQPVAEAPPAAATPAEAAQAPAAPAPVASNDNPAPPQAQEPAPSELAPAEPAQGSDSAARIAALLKEGVNGPAEIRIADRATLWLPAGRVFVPAEPAKKLAQEAGLEWRAGAQGVVAPASERLEWLAPVELLDDGFIKTGEADALQAEKLLAAFQAGLPEVNGNRAKGGQPPVALAGWLTPPALDDKHRLSACVNVATEGGASGGDKFFNCEAWALGRQGAIKVSVAEGGEQADKMKGEALALADTIVYDHGKAYEDIEIATDKSAPYAAADLLTSDVAAKGIAAAPAEPQEYVSLPLLLVLKLWKVILFAVVAIGGVIAWFRRRMEREADDAASARASRMEAVETPANEPVSLFARMLPTLHARFAKKSVPAQDPAAAMAREAGVDAVSSRGARDRSTSAEEPASALKKLATKMRGATPEPAPAPVDVARVIRAARTLPGAAPAPAAEPIMTEAPVIATPAPVTPKAPAPIAPQGIAGDSAAKPSSQQPSAAPSAPPAAKDEPAPADDFGGLVEPGDEAATSAAMHARESLRQATA